MPAPASTAGPTGARPPSTRFALGAALILAVAVLAAWWNALPAPFLLDDHNSILENPTLRDLASVQVLQPPATGGETVSGRPVLNLSLAINYALHGLDPRGFRLGNVLIHVAAALTLYGVIWRTLLLLGVSASRRFPAEAIALAFALVWALHPLQTAAVTYLVQRAESLAGLFALLTLYGFIRAHACGAHRRRWTVFAAVTCVLGMATKESVAALPLLVLLYDRAFVSGSFSRAWHEHRRFHLALAASWLVLAGLVFANAGRGGSAGLGSEIGAWTYSLTQCAAIVRYLALVVWPAPLVFDYGTPTVAGWGAVVPQFTLLTALAGGTLWALRRNHLLGFMGAWFFLTLAPSSSVIPVATQTMAEHRMYLPLIAVLAGIAWTARPLLRPLPPVVTLAAAGLVVLLLGVLTVNRHQTYRSALTLWRHTVLHRPDNARAHHNLGVALMAAEARAEATAAFERTLVLQPRHAFAHHHLGILRLLDQQWGPARQHFQAALAIDPGLVDARVNLAQVWQHLGRPEAAIEAYRVVLARQPSAPDVQVNLAGLLLDSDDLTEAETLLQSALAAAPGLPEAHFHWGRLLAKRGQTPEAAAAFRRAVDRRPDFAAAQSALGRALASLGRPDAEAALRQALRLDPEDASTHVALGNLLARRRELADAAAAFEAALRLEPDHIEARNNLGNCQLMLGRLPEAIASYEHVLRLRPGDGSVERNLAIARELLQRAR